MMLQSPLRKAIAAWLVVAAALPCPAARADTPLTLLQSFAGNVNFTGTQATMRTNRSVCDAVSARTKLNKALAGIPAGAQILSARLYWAGSSNSPDNQVTFDNKTVSAQRQYTSIQAGGTNYFGGAADVTAQVKANGNATYAFSGLTINNGRPWCPVEGVLGGFSLLVIYSHPAQPYRVLNVYEGFQSMHNSSITLNLGNFKIPNPIGAATGRLGHITWEGDASLNNGEDLQFNGVSLTDGGLNPLGNQFNSTSNINNDALSYGIDFDAYTINSPTIQADQTTATAFYKAGQDMVLLNAEIVAVPNVPVSNLSISMGRNGDPFLSQNPVYTLTVTNNGPSDESGPVNVTDTLPAGLTLVSASGTGWTCSTSGQAVTCTNPLGLAAGSALPVITLTAHPTSNGVYSSYTNTASVAGAMFDNNSSDNTATDTVADTTVTAADYAFTDKACTHGVAIATDPNASGCHRYTGPLIAGTNQPIYVTALNTNGIPTRLHISQTRQRTVRFSLTCINPTTNAGVRATYAGATLPLCSPAGTVPSGGTTSAWTSNVSLSFPGGIPSAPATFQYRDVGFVKLNLYDPGANTISSVRFISQPRRLSFSEIKRTSDNAVNPGETGTYIGFAMAGEPFTIKVTALLDDEIGAAPNFGKEISPFGVALGQTTDAAEMPALGGTFGAPVGGVFTGTGFHYDEAGYVSLKALALDSANPERTFYDYLGSGTEVGSETVKVGNFYPAYFITDVDATFPCQPRMACPTGTVPVTNEALGVNGGAYSQQPFTVDVTAHNVAGLPLKNYVSPHSHPITLSAVTLPGPSGVDAGTLVGSAIGRVSAEATLTAKPSFKVDPAFDRASPRAMNWAPPKTIYLRAETAIPRVGSPSGYVISSKRGPGAISVERGVRVVNGRLQVNTGFGSELLKLPVRLDAQYWTGSSWDKNTGDDLSQINASSAHFTNCSGKLNNLAAAPNNCKAVVATQNTSTSPPLTTVDGSASLWLKPTGAGNTGSAAIDMGNNNPIWLPSTLGRAVYGTHKSRLIYIREVY
jgi:MSHA biogenesis protein MshQ